tara:strand:+ start:14 stop:718 length:705 start_codon:yes stop_codon:yes gene_type:complete
MSKEKTKYNSWPIGKLPKDWQRPELDIVKKMGYDWEDPRDVIDIFEKKVAKFAGSKYAVSVDCCSNGIFLALKYLKAKGKITIPSKTYVSVPMQIMHAGCKVEFKDIKWSGIYKLEPYNVYDGAVRWTKGMYVGNNALQVVSFQLKKRIPIGKGGMILTDDIDAYNWLKKASYDGRDLSVYYPEDDFEIIGWHMYMTPEDAARGIILMDQVPEINEDSGDSEKYSDLSKKKCFK